MNFNSTRKIKNFPGFYFIAIFWCMKYNLSELVMTFYNLGWIINKLNFIATDWNEFCYYQCPDHIKISVKIIDYENIIVKLNYDNNRLLKVSFNNLYSLINDLFDADENIELINKVKENQKRVNKIDEDFEE